MFLIVCPMLFLAGFADAIGGGGGLAVSKGTKIVRPVILPVLLLLLARIVFGF